jgi:hypothetical protein
MSRPRSLEFGLCTRWSPVAIAKFGEFDGLSGVSARSARDVWAVGSSRVETEPNGDQVIDTLVLHFDGLKWSAARASTRRRSRTR